MRTPIIVCVVVIVAWAVENLAFGEDRPGTAHDISLAFFFVGVVAAVALLGLLAAALMRRLRHR